MQHYVKTRRGNCHENTLWFKLDDGTCKLEVSYMEPDMPEYIAIDEHTLVKIRDDRDDTLDELLDVLNPTPCCDPTKETLEQYTHRYISQLPSLSAYISHSLDVADMTMEYGTYTVPEGTMVRIYMSPSQNIWKIEDDVVGIRKVPRDDVDDSSYNTSVYTSGHILHHLESCIAPLETITREMDKSMVYCCMVPNTYRYGYTTRRLTCDTVPVYIIGKYPNTEHGYLNLSPFTWESIGVHVPSHVFPVTHMNIASAIKGLYRQAYNDVCKHLPRPSTYKMRLEGFGYIIHPSILYMTVLRGMSATILERYVGLYKLRSRDASLGLGTCPQAYAQDAAHMQSLRNQRANPVTSLLNAYPEMIATIDVFEHTMHEYISELHKYFGGEHTSRHLVHTDTRELEVLYVQYSRVNNIHRVSMYSVQMFVEYIISNNPQLWYTTVMKRLPKKYLQYYNRARDPITITDSTEVRKRMG